MVGSSYSNPRDSRLNLLWDPRDNAVTVASIPRTKEETTTWIHCIKGEEYKLIKTSCSCGEKKIE